MEVSSDSKLCTFGKTTGIIDRVIQTRVDVPPVNVDFRGLTLTVSDGINGRRKKTLLKDLSGSFKSGELTAIMGPSGAGKSSLLRVLTGFTTRGVEGSVKYNGRKQNSKETCYIMQDDCLEPLFTAYEIMTISANLKLGRNVSEKKKQLLVEDILDMMNLTICKDIRCSKLSGGQVKRLSIALELVGNPPVMFLDEPTTGLDSVSSLQCARVLKALAEGGHTVVCTIHQPCASTMSLFDHVYILCDGQCVYKGADYNLLPYFKQFGLECPRFNNPADFVMEVISGDYGSYQTQLIEAAKDETWKKSKHISGNDPVEDICYLRSENYLETTVEHIEIPSEFHKFCILLKLYYIQIYRDWTMSHLKAVLHIIVGVVFGVFFSNSGNNGSKTISNLGYMFVSIVYLSYTTILPAALRYPLERDVVVKEHFNNWYKLRTYYLAMTVSSIPVQLLYCVLNVCTSYFISSQPLEWQRFTMMLLMCFMNVVISEGFGIFFGILCKPVTGTFWGALFIAYCILFGGYVILFTHMPNFLYWLSYLSFYRFCYDGIVTSLYSYGRPKLMCPEEVSYCHLSSPEYILRELGIRGDAYWIDVGVLLLFFMLIRIVAYCSLKKVSGKN